MTRVESSWIMPVVVAGAAALLTAVVGATITDLGPWYHSLAQPRWAPPDVAYGVAWTAIYACTALAAVTGWRAAPNAREADWLIGLFALNGFLNILWSLLFFRFHRPEWAVVEVVVLWLSILALVVTAARYSRPAASLLLPYLAWVAFAGSLNLAVVRLNGPFA